MALDVASPRVGSLLTQHEYVLLGHGSGGKLTDELIDGLFRPLLLPDDCTVLNDSSTFQTSASSMAVTTDSFVVDPIFFPGGDIGKLAVNGTVNDLAVSGARPLLMTVAFILEEGLPIADLWRVVASMKEASQEAGVAIVGGDTKVVNRGKCDKLFINTTGVGVIDQPLRISADRARAGDLILVNGDIAAHGMAILAAREDLELDSPIESDTSSLHSLVSDMLSQSLSIHCLRDLTRGGLAGALNEIAACSRVGIRIWEDRIPIQDEVKGCCEILGLDPLQVANEGKLIGVIDREDAESVLCAMRNHPRGRLSSIIGEVVADYPGVVAMKTLVGGYRIVPVLTGEQLPRIC